MYDIKERGKILDAIARWELHQREPVPIWNHVRRWLESDTTKRVLPSIAIGEALGYLRNQWSALRAYLTDREIVKNGQKAWRRAGIVDGQSVRRVARGMASPAALSFCVVANL